MSKIFIRYSKWANPYISPEDIDLENEEKLLKLYTERFPEFESQHVELPLEMKSKHIENLLDVGRTTIKNYVSNGLLYSVRQVLSVNKVTHATPIRFPVEALTRFRCIQLCERLYLSELGKLPPKSWRNKVPEPNMSPKVVIAEKILNQLPDPISNSYEDDDC